MTPTQEAIAAQFTKTIKETISRFAKEFEVEEKEVQVFLGLDEQGNNVYKICHNYKPRKTVGFTNNGILKPKIDFSGRAAIVPAFINDLLMEIGSENQFEENKAGIMLINNEDSIKLYLYTGLTPIKPLEDEEVFSKIQL